MALTDALGAMHAWLRKRASYLAPAAALAIALLALFAIHRLLATVHLKDIRAAVAEVDSAQIARAVALTAASYLALTLYDWFALRTIGRPLPWRTAALASFTSYTLSHNLGFSLLTGGSARWRTYSAAGLSLSDVARITALASGNFWGGVFALSGLALLLTGGKASAGPLLGAWLIAAALLPVLLRAAGRRSLGWGRLTVPLPSLPEIAAQLLVSMLDLLCAAAALFVLVPGQSIGSLPGFFLAYTLAIIAGLVTHVPGGVGVFEATMLAIAPGPPERVFAALLLYRLIYYVLPLVVAGGLTVYLERHRIAAPLSAGRFPLRGIARAAAPSFLALAMFGAGLVLLLSGALPAVKDRMQALRELLPLSLVEAAHLSASITGVALILLAPALQARLKSGLILARILLLAGAVFSLLKGFDYEEASLMLLALGVLHLGRRIFYRRGGLAGAPPGDWWWAAALGAIVLSVWVGFLAYKHVPYSNELWLSFAWHHGSAPRFLRAALASTLVVIGFSVWRLTAAPAVDKGDSVLPADVAEAAFRQAARSDAMLAYTGDKAFLIARSREAFLMYRQRGRSLVVMGDPVGPRRDWSELAWMARALADRFHARLCFYQASADMLPILVELGLRPIKYGEEALIDLRSGFSLGGSARKSLRYSVNRAAAAGLRFEILPRADVPAHLDELRSVSDLWLEDKKKREKNFSLGRFDAAYLLRFDCAVLRQGEHIVAFANLWKTQDGRELSVDLMRHPPDAPYGTMDLLFVSLMQWGAHQGFERFNLGLAPLSGLTDSPLAPLWSRAGATLFEHGERFYGFSGLRSYKQKFDPVWVPRYIATPDGLAGWRALIDVAGLIGG
ncbi:bifunctional lysylphosphatidylglycerol flippase/synthetase MprF [Sphingomonas tabacisoli]|uniref:Bifunctional lysylphosphatidylglycerol flippase/synthetase MprF n=1 Tax=Sphingomonas tabacisoli TaxID=2249466 RepID=A0ABW4HZL2_9SPHN